MKLRLPLALATALLSACFSFSTTLRADSELIDYTLLSFDGNASNANIIKGWGSYATETMPYQGAGNPGYTVYGEGTPNIAVSFTAGVWQTHNLGSWGTTATGPEGGKVAAKGVGQIESAVSKVLFTSERKDEGVRLGSFNFNGHEVGKTYKFKVTVTGSLEPDTLLFEKEYSWTNNAGVIHNGGAVVDFNGLTGKTAGEALTLTMTILEGNNMNIAVDNILFSQAGYATYNTVLSRTLANDESSAWIGAGWKNGTEEATWTDSTAESGCGVSIAAGTGSTLTLLADETRSVEHIALTQGNLTISGGTLNLINVSTLDIRSGSILNLDTTVTVSECDTLSIWGGGLVVLKKDQIWNNLSGDGKLHLDADLTLNGDSIGVGGISLSGSGNLYKDGVGTTLIADISGMTGEGKIQVNEGVIKFTTSDFSTGELGKRIQVNKGGTASFDAATAGVLVLAPTISGNGTLALLATGGTSGDDAGMALDLSQSDFSGDVLISKGVLNVSTSHLVNKEGKSDGLISLQDGGILATASKTLTNEISVGTAGFLRANKDCKLTLNGGFSALGEASGTLSVYGPGEVILQGDFSRFDRGLTAKSGSNVTFDGVGNLGTVYVDAATANFTKESNIVAAGLGIKSTMNAFFSGTFNSQGLCSLEINSKLTLKEGANMSLGRIKMSDTGTANNGTTLDIDKGASFYITSGINNNNNLSSVVLGHWQGNATVNIRGLFEAQKGIAYMAISAMQGISTVNIYEGGIANFYGVNISAAKHILNLEGGTLNLGEKGLTSGNADVKVKINGGRIGTFSPQAGIAANLELQGDKGVTFNAGRYDLVNKIYTNDRAEIKVTSVISQAEGATGSLTKEGTGTLVLSGANTYKGGTVLKLGTLTLSNANALGANVFRNLTVEGNSVLTSSVAGKTIDNMTVKSGAVLNIGGLSQVNSLTIGTLAGAGTLAFDLSSIAAESDSLSLDSIAGDASLKLKFNVKKEELGAGYTRDVLKGIGAGNAGKISGIEHDYRNSLSITGSESGGNYQVKVSGSIDSANLAWAGTSTSGTWKIGTTGGASWTGAAVEQQAGFFSADKVTFGVPKNVESDKYHTVNLEGALSAESVLVATDATHYYRFTNAEGKNGYLTGAMSLTKDGTGTLVIDTKDANDYSGETLVKAGILEFKKGTFAGTGTFTVGKEGTLKSTDIFSTNTMTIAGTYELSLTGGLDTNLGTLSKVTWEAGSKLHISSGIATSAAGLFKNGSGPVLTLTEGGAFDLSGVNRKTDVFDAVISGQGVERADGTYTGALFNSVNTALVGLDSGLRDLGLGSHASISTSGTNGLNFKNSDGAIFINGELDLAGHTLTKVGYGRLGFNGTVKADSTGIIRIEQGSMRLDKDLGRGVQIELMAGTGLSSYVHALKVSSNITLDNSSLGSDPYYRPSDFARIFTYNQYRQNIVEYTGDVKLINGGAFLMGWGGDDNSNGMAVLSGKLSGTGTLYLDASGCSLSIDDDTDNSRIRHLYLGAEVESGMTMQMVGNAVLQFGTANSGLTQKNATIDGLSITGGREHILKFIATGADASYTGLKFATNAGESQGMALRVQNGSSAYLTTLTDTSGILETINVKTGAKLTMNGATSLSLNDNLTLEGTDSTFTLGGGSLTTNGRLLMKELSVFVISEGAGSFESTKVRSNGRGVDMLTGSSMVIKGGTVTLAGKTGIGVGSDDGTLTTGTYATVTQSGGIVNLADVWMSEYDSLGRVGRYDLSGGTLNVTGSFQLGLDGSAVLAISGGTATINKLSLGSVTGTGQSYSVDLSGTGRLNLGSDLVSLNTKANSTKAVILSGGTLGATANWSTSLDVNLKKDTATPGGVTVDTSLAGASTDTAATIKWLGAVKDHVAGTPGSLTVGGTGSLELGGVTSFTGEVTVKDSATFWNNTTNANGTLSASKVTIKDSGIFCMGMDNKKAGVFDVQGGQLLLDRAGVSVGDVALNGGDLNMSFAGVGAGAVTISDGALNVSTDATVKSLTISGGAGYVTGGMLTISTHSVLLNGIGQLKFTGTGTLNTAAIVTMASGTAIELGGSRSYLFGLNGDAGELVVNGNDVKAVYNGTATDFKGQVNVNAGQLTLGSVMTGAMAKVADKSHLIFSGAAEQVKNVSGSGKLSFSNTAVNITQSRLMEGFEGHLLVDTGHRVTFTGANNTVPTSMIGSKTVLEFGGNGSGVLVLNTVKETIHDVVLTANGAIELDKAGQGSILYLSGDSWYGNGTEQTMLTLDVGSNSVFVTDYRSMTDKQLDRLFMINKQGSGKVVLNQETGELSVDIALELDVPFADKISQSYMLTENHPVSGKHVLTDQTRIRALTIVASDTAMVKNTGLSLEPGVKLGLKIGELTVSGDSAYSITGGTLGMSATSINPADLLGSQFTITQTAKGLLTITSAVDATVHELRKSGAGDLLMSGKLSNKGGVLVEGGKLTLTGSTDVAGTQLRNRATLVLGNGMQGYTVNYAGLDADSSTSVTTFSSMSKVDKGFVVNNVGTLNLKMGGTQEFSQAFTGGGATVVSNGTNLVLPQGAAQSFTLEQNSSLTFRLAQASATGLLMNGEGKVTLNNTSGRHLDFLSGTAALGSSWQGFTGTVVMTGSSMTLDMGLMGEKAGLEVSANSRINDMGGAGLRNYQVKLGDGATWNLSDGATCMGTLALGDSGNLLGQGVISLNSDISGGTLNITGGTLSLGGDNTHLLTIVGADTTLIGTGASAFGQGLQLTSATSQAQIIGEVVTGSLNVADGAHLKLTQGSLTVTGGMEFQGILSGSGDLNLRGNNLLAGTISEDDTMEGATVRISQGELTVLSTLGKATLEAGFGGRLTISGNEGLSDNILILNAGSTLNGGTDFNGVLKVKGNGSNLPEDAIVNGGLNAQSLHLLDPTAILQVNGNLNVSNGGSFVLSDVNAQASLQGSIIKAKGTVSLSGVFGIDVDVNNSFTNSQETLAFQLFKGDAGLNITAPEGGQSVRLDIDPSMREFFKLNQENFASTGAISITRTEMTCYLLDPTYVTGEGVYADGYRAPNRTSYLGANANNDGTSYPEVFFFDKAYTIGAGDDAYRLTNGDAWMNFHVMMTDQQLDAPTRLIVRDNWMSKGEKAGGVILSIRGNADNTYSGGTQIFQSKVKVDGSLNGGAGVLAAGDVYFFGTGAVEAIGEKAEIILNTGGNGDKTEYLFHNEFQLQQGAVLTQTASKNVLMGNLTVRDMGTLRNLSDEDMILSGSRLNANNIEIQGSEDWSGSIVLEGVMGDKVTAKFTLTDLNNSGKLSVGRNATANITSLYVDKGSSVKVSEGGVLSIKEIKNGANGSGNMYMSGGTLRLMGDYSMTRNGALFHVTENSYFDTNGYYLDINQDISGWSGFTVNGGGTMVLNGDTNGYYSEATIDGKDTSLQIASGKTLTGTWTIQNGGTLRTEEDVILSGTINVKAGGSTSFGVGTTMKGAVINMKNGATYAGFLKGEGSTINFESGSHFQVKTEDLRKLTETTEKALLIADQVNIENGKGFFNFSGGDGIINNAIIDSGKEKTLILGLESLTVGGMNEEQARAVSNTSVLELTTEQLASMVGETTYRWLSFELSAEKSGESGAKINLTVTRNVNFSELAQTSNEIAIAPTLSYIGMEGGKTDSELEGVELNELGLALTKAKDNAGQMLSNISLSTSSVMAGYSVQRENLRRHTLELRDRAVQERPCALRNQYETLENTVWASGQGGTYSVDGDSNAVGHTTTLWGGQLGVGRCVNDNLVLGLAFTYTSSEINLDQGMGDATSDAYYIDLYAKYHKDNWNVTGILTGGFTDLSTERNMSIDGFSSQTKGSSSGNQLMGMVEVGYEFDLDGDRSNIIEPFAALTTGYSSIDGFEETGAGTAGLNVASQSDTSCSIGAGVRYVKEFSTSSDELLRGRFEVRAMILQDMTDNEVDVEARFIGANGQGFTQKSTEIGKTGFLLGTGVVVPTSANMAIFADLNGEFRSSETGCNANIGVKYNF